MSKEKNQNYKVFTFSKDFYSALASFEKSINTFSVDFYFSHWTHIFRIVYN